jgi:hypothetical protein
MILSHFAANHVDFYVQKIDPDEVRLPFKILAYSHS